MFDLAEKQIAISEAVTISDWVGSLPESEVVKVPIFIKALANYIEKTSVHSSGQVLLEVERSLAERNPDRALRQILLHMVTIGTTEDTLNVRMYTTGEVARFFGVSVATINNWINQGRFLGVEKGKRFKQVRIPENAVYIAPTGIRTTVAEASEMYEIEQTRYERMRPMTEAEELAELFNAVVHFEKKYGGTYEQTLGSRSDLEAHESRDADQWRALLQSIERRGAGS